MMIGCGHWEYPPQYHTILHRIMHCCFFLGGIFIVNFNGLTKGKIYRKPLIFPWHMGVSCNFSLKPINGTSNPFTLGHSHGQEIMAWSADAEVQRWWCLAVRAQGSRKAVFFKVTGRLIVWNDPMSDFSELIASNLIHLDFSACWSRIIPNGRVFFHGFQLRLPSCPAVAGSSQLGGCGHVQYLNARHAQGRWRPTPHWKLFRTTCINLDQVHLPSGNLP